jgi:hypothetical protein
MLAIPDKLYKEQNCPICVCFLMVPILEKGYGYGYGKAVERKVWYKIYI